MLLCHAGRMSADLAHLPVALSRIGRVTGDPVVVLPGGPCRDPAYLGDLAGLGDTCPIVVLHPRGVPGSTDVSRGWWTDADDVIAVIDALGLEHAQVVAHSAGTRLALAAATRFPGRIRSMALITPPATWITGTPHDGDSIPLDRTNPAVAAAIDALQEDDPATESEFTAAFLRQTPATYAHWSPVEQAHATIGSVSLAATSAWFTGIPADAVEQVRAARIPPTLVIGGDRDYLTGVQPVRDYAAALGAEVAFIRDCGHYPWVEQPAEFRSVMRSWLSSADVL